MNRFFRWSLLALVAVHPFKLMAADADKPAEKPAWKKEMVGLATLAQAHVDNWAQGGDDSLAWALNLTGGMTWDSPRENWSNKMKLAYGQTKVGDQDYRKTDDTIHAETTYIRKLWAKINPYASVVWDTQFFDGYVFVPGPGGTTRVTVSKFMDPGYLTESVGMAYVPNDFFKTRLGAAAKQTITDVYPVPFADDPSTVEIEKFKSELGVTSVTDIHWVINPASLFTSQLELFSNMKASDQVDVKWTNALSTKLMTYLTMNASLDILYDKDVSTRSQLKEQLNLGLSYNFL